MLKISNSIKKGVSQNDVCDVHGKTAHPTLNQFAGQLGSDPSQTPHHISQYF